MRNRSAAEDAGDLDLRWAVWVARKLRGHTVREMVLAEPDRGIGLGVVPKECLLRATLPLTVLFGCGGGRDAVPYLFPTRHGRCDAPTRARNEMNAARAGSDDDGFESGIRTSQLSYRPHFTELWHFVRWDYTAEVYRTG